MAATNITLSIKRAWWVMPYIYGVQLFSELTCLNPDYDKVATTIARGFTVVIK